MDQKTENTTTQDATPTRDALVRTIKRLADEAGISVDILDAALTLENAFNPDQLKDLAAIIETLLKDGRDAGEPFGYTLTRDNTTAIEAALTAVLDVSRPEVYHQQDSRITPEADAKRRADNEAARIERERAEKEKTAALHAAGQLTDHEKSAYDTKTIADIMRKELAVKYPQCRFSVTIERYSGGSSITACLVSAPFKALTIDGEDYFQCGHVYGEYTDGISNGPRQRLTREAWAVMREVQAIADRYNWDKSDSMTDYFNVHFYLHLEIGAHNRPFKVIDAPAAQDTPAAPITGAQVRRNHEKNGVEVLFPDKPAPETIAALKAAGFRWSFKTRVWYVRYSEEMEAAARKIIGQ